MFGILAGAIYLLTGNNPDSNRIIGIGGIVLAVLFLAYRAYLRGSSKPYEANKEQIQSGELAAAVADLTHISGLSLTAGAPVSIAIYKNRVKLRSGEFQETIPMEHVLTQDETTPKEGEKSRFTLTWSRRDTSKVTAVFDVEKVRTGGSPASAIRRFDVDVI